MSGMLFEESETVIDCERCGVRLKVTGRRNPKAKMLRRADGPKGLCVNCAVHDWLRNTYPVNILLAQSGPKGLAMPHIQEQFTGIMRTGMADAMPDEINWDLIIENWELPFPHKVKPGPMNPCSQKEIDEIKEGKRQGFSTYIPEPDPLHGKTTITTFEELNLLRPGLGDKLRKCLKKE
ncbi:MAG TPA: hypothetical protein VMW16_11275 [Sedimentisphaerales bacterium]|nr:hypothetical protein [Sedimentisphaerales bacterium]